MTIELASIEFDSEEAKFLYIMNHPEMKISTIHDPKEQMVTVTLSAPAPQPRRVISFVIDDKGLITDLKYPTEVDLR